MNRFLVSFLAFFSILNLSALLPAQDLPHIVLILADDMGYGDVRAFNSDSRIPTPHLDRLAGEGMILTDSHSPSAVCTPTRYGVLTGRYAWRTRLKRGVLGGYSPPLIERDRLTLGGMLRSVGYRTVAIGKWHLGMKMPLKPGRELEDRWEGDPGIDFEGRITDSPIHHGFDYFFGVSASLDMAPYVYIRNDRFAEIPVYEQPAVPFPHFVRKGPRSEEFVIDQVLDRLIGEAVGNILTVGRSDEPLFLYLALTAPHKPTQPSAKFRGTTGLGEYGDFVAQVDSSVGSVIEALEEAGIADETLLIYSSDNGSYMFQISEREGPDHVTDPSKQGYFPQNHRPNGKLRGTKADIWEAGHRVPLIVKWPDKIKAGSRSDSAVGLIDIFATLAEIVNFEIDSGVAEDSRSILNILEGTSGQRSAPLIHHSVAGMFAIRSGPWKLILGDGSGGREKPAGEPFGRPYKLFNVADDIEERKDLAQEHPEIVKQLTAEFEEYTGLPSRPE